MRTFVMFALALSGMAVFADAADAGIIFGRRGGRGRGNDCCPQQVAASPCCGASAGYGVPGYGGAPGIHGAAFAGPGYAMTGTPCCGSSGAVTTGGYYGSRAVLSGDSYIPAGIAPYHSGGTFPGTAGLGGTTIDGRSSVITTTDGQTYQLGSDGSYYLSTSGATMGGFTTQPYWGGTYGSQYYSPYRSGYYPSYPSGVYPAGYYGSPYYGGGLYPAGGTTNPLTMPGINIGPGGIQIVPNTMPPRK